MSLHIFGSTPGRVTAPPTGKRGTTVSSGGRRVLAVFGAAAILGFTPVDAWAYVGPGAGLTTIGTMLAVLGAVCFAILGFVWYPAKVLLRRLRARRDARPTAVPRDPPSPQGAEH